jgi:polysaccharide export outer membrane protein
MGGSPATNYQLFPGDRLYIQSNCLITLNNRLAQLFAPLERVFGITLLGSATVNAVRNALTKGGAGAPGGF